MLRSADARGARTPRPPAGNGAPSALRVGGAARRGGGARRGARGGAGAERRHRRVEDRGARGRRRARRGVSGEQRRGRGGLLVAGRGARGRARARLVGGGAARVQGRTGGTPHRAAIQAREHGRLNDAQHRRSPTRRVVRDPRVYVHTMYFAVFWLHTMYFAVSWLHTMYFSHLVVAARRTSQARVFMLSSTTPSTNSDRSMGQPLGRLS